MSSDNIPDDGFILPNPADYTIQPKFAAERLGVTTQTLRNMEREYGLDVQRVQMGAVSARVYKPADVFDMAALRRSRGNTVCNIKPTVMTVYVQKGGTGKSTFTVNLSIQFALMGYRVLVVDNDPQGDTTSMFGYDPDMTPEELEANGIPGDRAVHGHIANLLNPKQIFDPMPLEDVLKKPFGENGPHLIPADNTLDELEVLLHLSGAGDSTYSYFLERAMSKRAEQKKTSALKYDLTQYDIILFDNAPSTSNLTRNTLVASDFLLCPIRVDKLSFRALSRLHHRLIHLEEDMSRSPTTIAVPTWYVRGRPRYAANLEKLQDIFEDGITQTTLDYSEEYDKAMEAGIPLSFWKNGTTRAGGAYTKLAKEVIETVHKVQQFEGGESL